jgi:predicted nucleic acid-binding Zn ribbon protein
MPRKDMDKKRAYERRYQHAHIKNRYNITLEEWDIMLLQQGGVCAICKRPQSVEGKRLAVDHDHITNRVRGLLCNPCNMLIGLMEKQGKSEGTELLISIYKYLGW